MRAWRDRNSAPQPITSLMVVFDPTSVLSCFCFMGFSLLVSLSRVPFTPSECHSNQKNVVKLFSLSTHTIAQLQSAVVVFTSTSPNWEHRGYVSAWTPDSISPVPAYCPLEVSLACWLFLEHLDNSWPMGAMVW